MRNLLSGNFQSSTKFHQILPKVFLSLLIFTGIIFPQNKQTLSKSHFLERPSDTYVQPAVILPENKQLPEFEEDNEDAEEYLEQRAGIGEESGEGEEKSYRIAPYRSIEHELKSFEEIQNFKKSIKKNTSSTPFTWNPRGPFGFSFTTNSSTISYSGRINSIAYTSDGKYYLTSAHGGLWGYKSGYSDLKPLSDGLPTLAVSAVAVHPTDHDTIILATGDYNYQSGADSCLGIYRSYNGGVSWTKLQFPMPPYAKISKIMMPAWDPSLVLVSTNNGFYRSTDLGNTWETSSLVAGSNISDFDAARDGHFLLAGLWNDGLYRSIDTGRSWTRIPLPSDTAAPFSRGRISVGISFTAYTYAYVVIGRTQTNQVMGVYKTETADIITNPTWTNITPPAPNVGYMWGQQQYNNCIAVSHGDANTVYIGGGSILKTTNGGGVWTQLDWQIVHCDVHTLVATSDGKLLAGADGGIFVSTNNGSTWDMTLNRQLSITEFYNIDVKQNDRTLVYGAAQDNGIIKSTGGNQYWAGITGGDGLNIRIDPRNSNLLYSLDATPARRNKSTNGGANWSNLNTGPIITDWSTTVEPDPLRTNWIYSNNRRYAIFSTNGGANWDTMGNNWGISFVTPNSSGSLIYAPAIASGGNLLFGYVYNSGTGGWFELNLTPYFPRRKQITRICPSMSNSFSAYAIVSAVDSGRIFKTNFSGLTWRDITGDLPDVQVNDLIESPYNSNILWIGTEKGAFKTTDGGTTWYRWNDGLPDATKITDLEYSYFTEGGVVKDVIVAGTFGRSAHERRVDTEDISFIISQIRINMGVLAPGITFSDSFVVHNNSDALLYVPSIFAVDSNLIVEPKSYQISPFDSLVVRLTFNSKNSKSQFFSDDISIVHILDNPNAIMETSYVSLSAVIQDSTRYRSFIPESLITKTAAKPKAQKSSWCFEITPGPYGWNIDQPAPSKVRIKFKNAVDAITEYEPFFTVKKIDKAGVIWQLSDGSVGFNQTMTLCGRNKKISQQSIIYTQWMNESDSVISTDSTISTSYLENTPVMPNAANFRKEVFSRYPFSSKAPLVVGVADPSARKKNIAYVAFSGEMDVQASLAPGKFGKAHTGNPECFNQYANKKKMAGKLTRLPYTKQDNHLFAELTALKLNIAASALGITPHGFGELRYSDSESPFDGYLLRDLVAIADTFMTYCVDSIITDPDAFDTVITKINSAFSGEIDTISFSKNLVLTGVRSISEVNYLKYDPNVMQTIIIPSMAENHEPVEFRLMQNYPNPFNPSTTISFRISEPAKVTLKVYNLLGQVVASLLDGETFEAGEHETSFDTKASGGLASGVYFYRLSIEHTDEEGIIATYTDVKKMLLVK